MTGMAMAPLVAGNPVIIKPAEQSSIIGALLSEILQELDLPPGATRAQLDKAMQGHEIEECSATGKYTRH